MALIADETVLEVKRSVDIYEIVSGYLGPLKRAGASYKGLCPFHEEKTPSFTVSPQRQTFHCFGCRIVYHDPVPRNAEDLARLSARALSLEELLKTADIVTLHVPLLPQTRSMIGPRQLRMMKPGAVLIQASRGGIVHEAALAAHLNSGHLGGAAVDVYSSEPPDNDNPLLNLEGEAARRAILTPHVAGVTPQASANLFTEAWANVERVLVKGEAPRNRVY